MAKRKNQKRRSKKYQVNNRQLKAKRMYKDTIFRMLYHNKENLLSLYNAVNEESTQIRKSCRLLHWKMRFIWE